MPPEALPSPAEIEQLDNPSLRALWAKTFGRRTPRCASREFMILSLSWRAQELTHGGLSPAAKRRLAELAEDGGKRAHRLAATQRLKPGTRLVREWHGKPHHVTVLEDGFAYDGRRFESLSEIARTIAGARWSGPLFFGLRKHSRSTGAPAHDR